MVSIMGRAASSRERKNVLMTRDKETILLLILGVSLIPLLMYPVYRMHCWLTKERPPYWPWLFWTYLAMCLFNGLVYLFDWLLD
jgi:hypothetical protein